MALFSRSAAGFVCGDGAELFAWDANIDGPTWHQPTGAPIVAVAAGGALVITLGSDGTLRFWNGRDGSSSGSASVPGGHSVAMAWESGCAVAAADRIEIFDAQGRRQLGFPGVTALRFSRDDKKLALGSENGGVVLVDVASGAALGSMQLPEGRRVTGLFERAPGEEWLATGGDGLYALDPRGMVRRVTGMTGSVLKDVAVNERGTLVALQANDNVAVVLAWSSRDTASSLSYPERTITGITLGSRALWVGLDLGDGNKQDLMNGTLYRTDPHPGRPRNTWLVATGHEPHIAQRLA